MKGKEMTNLRNVLKILLVVASVAVTQADASVVAPKAMAGGKSSDDSVTGKKPIQSNRIYPYNAWVAAGAVGGLPEYTSSAEWFAQLIETIKTNGFAQLLDDNGYKWTQHYTTFLAAGGLQRTQVLGQRWKHAPGDKQAISGYILENVMVDGPLVHAKFSTMLDTLRELYVDFLVNKSLIPLLQIIKPTLDGYRKRSERATVELIDVHYSQVIFMTQQMYFAEALEWLQKTLAKGISQGLHPKE